MDFVPTNMTVADFCNALHRREIVVNRDYQRSDKVWPDIAKSFLIETLVLDYPMPKLSLYQITDLKTRKTLKEIVDGQQRSAAILEFFDDELQLSFSLETEDIAGKRLSQIPDKYQSRFLDYSISIDLFVSVTPEEVREVFRRMNSYTVPLNPEEQRHASFQGPFKWFIDRLARQYNAAFVEMAVFTQKQIVRMNDAKLLTELSHALYNGITTTNKRTLDALYRSRNVEFAEESETSDRLVEALDQVLDWHELHGTRLMKSYMMYPLVLATTHAINPVGTLEESGISGGDGLVDRADLVRNLSWLLEALGTADEGGDVEAYAEFVLASSAKTNTAANRKTRLRWFYKALTQEQL